MKNSLLSLLFFVSCLGSFFLLQACCDGYDGYRDYNDKDKYFITVDSPDQIINARYLGSELALKPYNTTCEFLVSTSFDTTKVIIETVHETDTLFFVTHASKSYAEETSCTGEKLYVERTAPSIPLYTSDSVRTSSHYSNNNYTYYGSIYYTFHIWP
jgi:hypothetical protein